jgi:hypothetical protein
MTKENMRRISREAVGNISDWNCRVIVASMCGYMMHARDLDEAKQFFYEMIEAHTNTKKNGNDYVPRDEALAQWEESQKQ